MCHSQIKKKSKKGLIEDKTAKSKPKNHMWVYIECVGGVYIDNMRGWCVCEDFDEIQFQQKDIWVFIDI